MPHETSLESSSKDYKSLLLLSQEGGLQRWNLLASSTKERRISCQNRHPEINVFANLDIGREWFEKLRIELRRQCVHCPKDLIEESSYRKSSIQRNRQVIDTDQSVETPENTFKPSRMSKKRESPEQESSESDSKKDRKTNDSIQRELSNLREQLQKQKQDHDLKIKLSELSFVRERDIDRRRITATQLEVEKLTSLLHRTQDKLDRVERNSEAEITRLKQNYESEISRLTKNYDLKISEIKQETTELANEVKQLRESEHQLRIQIQEIEDKAIVFQQSVIETIKASQDQVVDRITLLLSQYKLSGN